MEIANHKPGGFMKSMLVMSFYRSNKPSPSPQYKTNVVVSPKPSSSVQKVSSFAKLGGFSYPDGYVHGPNGVGGDEHVDKKATSFISQVKERLRLEEMSIVSGSTEEYTTDSCDCQ